MWNFFLWQCLFTPLMPKGFQKDSKFSNFIWFWNKLCNLTLFSQLLLYLSLRALATVLVLAEMMAALGRNKYEENDKNVLQIMLEVGDFCECYQDHQHFWSLVFRHIWRNDILTFYQVNCKADSSLLLSRKKVRSVRVKLCTWKIKVAKWQSHIFVHFLSENLKTPSPQKLFESPVLPTSRHFFSLSYELFKKHFFSYSVEGEAKIRKPALFQHFFL